MPTSSLPHPAAAAAGHSAEKHAAAESTVEIRNFIRARIDQDLAQGKHQQVVTRFPPEPNGYLHIGHIKAIWINFGIQEDYRAQGTPTACHLRFDDTNPEKESVEYAQGIEEDIRWLGFSWDGPVRWASDYFEALYQFAEHLIESGLAYVCDLPAEEIRRLRGSFTEAGQNSPYRERSRAENRDLFQRMRAGEFADGSRTLRLKIDMASPNLNLRDPVIYRIRHARHIRTQDAWCVYPMYDYTHCLSDALEGITHSLCSLEFEDHRALYDWVLDHVSAPCHPQQIEFARMEVSYCLTSKRMLHFLVNHGFVCGWDDPRMPTVRGLRRRGYSPAGLRLFAQCSGVAKSENRIDYSVLETTLREVLEAESPRVIAVLRPLKVTLTNFQPSETASRSAPFHPHHPEWGEREIPVSRTLYIDAEDFSLAPPPGWKRLAPGGEVRLRYGYVIRCDEAITNPAGEVTELRCSLDPQTLGQNPVGRKVKGVIHWLSAEHAVPATFRLYDRLFQAERPALEREGDSYSLACTREMLNPHSLEIVQGYVEPTAAAAEPETRYQFERVGYFVADRFDHTPSTRPTGAAPVFNRTANLKESWKEGEKPAP